MYYCPSETHIHHAGVNLQSRQVDGVQTCFGHRGNSEEKAVNESDALGGGRRAPEDDGCQKACSTKVYVM